MSKLKSLIGMAYASPVVRTAVQAGLAVLVAAGTGYLDVSVLKAAAVAAGAAALAKLQELSRG